MTVIIGWPQFIVLAFIVINLIIHIVMHGEEQPEYNAYIKTLDIILSLLLLAWGGFFG